MCWKTLKRLSFWRKNAIFRILGGVILRPWHRYARRPLALGGRWSNLSGISQSDRSRSNSGATYRKGLHMQDALYSHLEGA